MSWDNLPAEILRCILGYTDLCAAGPTVSWKAGRGFMIDQDSYHKPDPSPLFLVSRLFYQQAREVFWRHNSIVLVDDRLPGSEDENKDNNNNGLPKTRRWAMSQLLSEHVLPHTIPCIRSIHYHHTSNDGQECAGAGAEQAMTQQQQHDWAQTFDYALGRGLNALCIRAHWNERNLVKREEIATDTGRPGEGEEVFHLVRNRLLERFWPWMTEHGTPRGVSWQLRINLSVPASDQDDSYIVSWSVSYEIRRDTPRPACLDPSSSHTYEQDRDCLSDMETLHHRRVVVPGSESAGGDDEVWVEAVWKTPVWTCDSFDLFD